ncbi:MAG: NUDIX hydrolase [Cryomorphaceae bacterium]|nr:NUDIX hydrolase [Cryomorphaceae bacterium]
MKLRTSRVYGFLINNSNQVLVSAERFNGIPLIKFPGGGVEWGEGLQEALIREFKEELKISIGVKENIYFNDFPVESAIDKRYQVQAFFYHVEPLEPMRFSTVLSLKPPEKNTENFIWVDLKNLNEELFTYEIEKEAVKALRIYAKKHYKI